MKIRIMLGGFCLLGVVMGGTVPVGAAQNPPPTPCGPNLGAEIKNVRQDSRCFELRTYTVREGSSIDLLHARFRDHTTALFEKHGMTIIGYWQPTTQRDTLIYMLAYPDRAARARRMGRIRSRSGMGPDTKRNAGERPGRERLYERNRLLADEIGCLKWVVVRLED